ncbi:MAG: LPS export ABC transporter periplasmic protein LptC [Prolixibacteraceae bacterium]|nr:LPS export ABC transporter periplasmic protein LptC [Prolixibacteraceae bacterium]
MKNNNFFLIKLKSIATFTMVAMLFLSCQKNDVEKIKSFEHPPGAPEILADSITVLFSDSAIVRFILTAPKLKIYQDEEEPHTEFPEGFVIKQFNKDNIITSNIKADYGKHFEDKELWEARQNVVAVTENNDTLKTDLLFWDEKNDKIYSDQFVKFIQQEQIITGIGFESDLQMKNWHIKNVKGTVIVETED